MLKVSKNCEFPTTQHFSTYSNRSLLRSKRPTLSLNWQCSATRSQYILCCLSFSKTQNVLTVEVWVTPFEALDGVGFSRAQAFPGLQKKNSHFRRKRTSRKMSGSLVPNALSLEPQTSSWFKSLQGKRWQHQFYSHHNISCLAWWLRENNEDG